MMGNECMKKNIVITPFEKLYVIDKISKDEIVGDHHGIGTRHFKDIEIVANEEEGYKLNYLSDDVSVKVRLIADWNKITSNDTTVTVSVKNTRFKFEKTIELRILKQSFEIIQAKQSVFTTETSAIATLAYGTIDGQEQGDGEEYQLMIDPPGHFITDGGRSQVVSIKMAGTKRQHVKIFLAADQAHIGKNHTIQFKIKSRKSNMIVSPQPLQLDIVEPPKQEWTSEFIPSEEVIIGRNRMFLGVLTLKDITHEEYANYVKKQCIKLSSNSPDILFASASGCSTDYEERLEDKVKVNIYLKGETIKHVTKDYLSQVFEIKISDGVQTENVNIQLAANALNNDSHESIKIVKIKAKEICDNHGIEKVIYEDDTEIDFELWMKAKSDLENICCRADGCKFVGCDSDKSRISNNGGELLISNMFSGGICKIKCYKDALSDVKYEGQIIIDADYCYQVHIPFTINKQEKEAAKLSIKLDKTEVKCVFIGGQDKHVANLTLKNDTKTSDTRCAHSAIINDLVFANEKKNKITSFYLTDENDKVVAIEKLQVLFPQEIKTFKVWCNATEVCEKGSFKFGVYSPTYERIEYRSIEIKEKVLASRGPRSVFTIGQGLKYQHGNGGTIQVGTIKVEKSEQKDVGEFINRTNEKITIEDVPDKNEGCSFYFVENGEEKKEIVISNLSQTPYEAHVFCRIPNWSNKKYRLEFVYRYSCDQERDDRPENKTVVIDSYVQNPVLEILDDTGKVISKDDNRYVINKLYSYSNANLTYNYSLITKFYICNASKVPYGDYKLTIESIELEDCKDLLKLEIDKSMPCEIYNGEESFSVGLKILWKNYKEIKESAIKGDVTIKYSISSSEEKTARVSVLIDMQKRADTWYSLDLGTTGIVLAKDDGDNLNLIPINEAPDDHLEESDANIMSSIVAAFYESPENNKMISLELNPDRVKYFSNAIHTLIPAKFFAGLNEIPFLDLSSCNRVKLPDGSTHGVSEVTPRKLIECIYGYTFAKVGANLKDCEALILTYPNTYVPIQREALKEIAAKKFPNMQIHLVSESDAVVVYYIYKKYQGKGFKDGTEHILFYDMGAGTLDISYVDVTKDAQRKIKVNITKRIGLPIGGNYLDCLINDEIQDLIKDEKPIKVKRWISDKVKCCEDTEKGVKEILFQGETLIKENAAPKKIQEVFGSARVNDYLELCTTIVMDRLLGSKKTELDTVVFSGRASLFKPLQKKMQEVLNQIDKSKGKASAIRIDTETIKPNECKTCVAIGAIHYRRDLEDSSRYDFEITSRSQYYNIGMVYNKEKENNGLEESYEEFVINSDNNGQTSWTDSVNGTRYLYKGEKVMDLRRSKKVTFVQTILNKEETISLLKDEKRQIERDCFMHTIFVLKVPNYDQLEMSKVEIMIDIDNNITVKINENQIDAIVSEDVSKNNLYLKSFWPFTTTNKK